MTGITTARVIDVHAHVVLLETLGSAEPFGPTIGTYDNGKPYFEVGKNYRLDGVRYLGSPFVDFDVRIERMDARGIDFQVLSPNPLTYLHFIAPTDAVRFCQAHNNAVSAHVARYPDRLAAFAALPMQDPLAAKEELERAVTELGLVGGYFGTDMPLPLHDAQFDPLYEAAVRLNVPLFIHPGPAGIDGPLGDPNLKRFDLDVIAGFAAQETLAVATLIFGEVLDRHPRLDICISHGGGAVALLSGRMAHAARKRPWVPAQLRADGAFEERLARLWFDTHLDHPDAESMLSRIAGRGHLVYGTNFAGWDAPEEGNHDAVAPDLADNARRLLRCGPGAQRTITATRGT